MCHAGENERSAKESVADSMESTQGEAPRTDHVEATTAPNEIDAETARARAILTSMVKTSFLLGGLTDELDEHAPAHIENLGNRDCIAEEKSALGRSLPDHGTLLVPAACDYADYLAKRSAARTVYAGNCRGQVRAERLRQGLDGCEFDLIIGTHEPVPVHLPIPGRHMVTNALLAAGIGNAFGLTPDEIAEGLNQANITSGRLRRFSSRDCTVIDDSYNANPESMAAALQTLAECPVEEKGRRFAILGHMAELGDTAESAHERVGRLAAQLELDHLITVGEEASAIARAALAQGNAHTVLDFYKFEDAVAALEARIRPGDTLLFKGSRAAAIERVMHAVFPEPSSKTADPAAH